MTTRWITALPVYNEVQYLDEVLDQVKRFSANVVAIDDGSTDGSAEALAKRNDLHVVTHARNLGYGAALKSAFRFAVENQFETIVTIDCDGQHEPQRIPSFVAASRSADIVSGSRYLQNFPSDSAPPSERRFINRVITTELNQQLDLSLTDAFCGFKAYRVEALKRLRIDENGYAMPLELWVRAARSGLRIVELPVPLIYLDASRSFGDELDDGETRLAYYYEVLHRSLQETHSTSSVTCGENAG